MIDIALYPFDKHLPIVFFSEFVRIGEIKDHNVYFSSLGGRLIVCTKQDPINLKLKEEGKKEPKISEQMCKEHLVSFFVTTLCNCNCRYCYASGANTKHPRLSFKKAREFLDLFIKKEGKVSTVRFFGGGEPTTEMPMIKKTIEYAKEKHGIRLFEIQTNLLFDEDTAEYIANNFSSVICSVDGPEEIQVRHRQVTPEQNRKIEENLGFLLSKKVSLLVKCTVSKYSNDKLREIVDCFSSLGVKKAMMDIICQKGNASVPKDDYNTPPKLEDFLEKFVEAKKYAERKGIFIISWFLPVECSGLHFCQNQLFCDPCLTTDGYISVCDEYFLGEGKDNPFIIGRVDWEKKEINYDEKKVALLKNRTVPNLPNCRDCFLKWSCRGQCPSRCLSGQGDIYKPSEDECKLIKHYSHEYLLYKAREALDGRKKRL